MADKVSLECPCCRTKLVVDVQTGDVLSEERPKGPYGDAGIRLRRSER